jgi:hypothetical protein
MQRFQGKSQENRLGFQPSESYTIGSALSRKEMKYPIDKVLDMWQYIV